MNTNLLRKILYIFLNITRTLLFLALISIPVLTILNISHFSIMIVINLLLSALYIFNYFNVSNHLLRILKSCEKSPFTISTVNSFKIMGYCLFVNTIFECVMGYKGSQNLSNIQILATNSGALTPVMIICLMSSLMSFVIADAFDKAIKIKEENDLTI